MKITENPKKTKSGQYSTSEDVLNKLSNEHEIVEQVLSFREFKKLQSTYVDALPTWFQRQTALFIRIMHRQLLQPVVLAQTTQTSKYPYQNGFRQKDQTSLHT